MKQVIDGAFDAGAKIGEMLTRMSHALARIVMEHGGGQFG